MQSGSSRIWTRVVVFISCDDNHYTIIPLSVFLPFLHFVCYFVNPLLIVTNCHCLDNGICLPSYHPDECGTSPFLTWVLAHGFSLYAPDIPQNASGTVGIPIKMERPKRQAINLNPPKKVKAWWDGPLRPEVSPETRHTRPDPCRWHHGRRSVSHQVDSVDWNCLDNDKYQIIWDILTLVILLIEGNCSSSVPSFLIEIYFSLKTYRREVMCLQIIYI